MVRLADSPKLPAIGILLLGIMRDWIAAIRRVAAQLTNASRNRVCIQRVRFREIAFSNHLR